MSNTIEEREHRLEFLKDEIIFYEKVLFRLRDQREQFIHEMMEIICK